jgi:hypothetical protein
MDRSVSEHSEEEKISANGGNQTPVVNLNDQAIADISTEGSEGSSMDLWHESIILTSY